MREFFLCYLTCPPGIHVDFLRPVGEFIPQKSHVPQLHGVGGNK
jgi:hypothetical protein